MERELKYYLKAMEILLSKQEQSCYTLDMLSECIEEDDEGVDANSDFFGDGYCLLEEIRMRLKD